MTSRREEFLASRRVCPACGAARVPELDARGWAVFGCGTVFAIIEGVIKAVRACPLRSERAARHWNQQTEEKSEPDMGDSRCTE